MMLTSVNSRARIVNSDGTPSTYFMEIMRRLVREANGVDSDLDYIMQPTFEESANFEPILQQGKTEHPYQPVLQQEQKEEYTPITQPARKRIHWDDFSIPLTRDKQGQSTKPDYDFTNLGLLFPQNDATEIVYLVFQMSHAKKFGTDIKLHLHYIQNSADKPTFKIEYKWYNNGDTVPGSWTTISTADGNKGVFTYSSGDMLQIGSFPAISPPAGENVSSNLDVKFYREDNDMSGDCLGKYIDFHFQKDKEGSREEYKK